MLGKETIGHGDLERLHIGHRPRSLVGCGRPPGLQTIDAQFDQIAVPGAAVLYPPLDHETTQPSPYPAIQILEDRQRLDQPEVPYPAAKEHNQLLRDSGQRYAAGSPGDHPDPIPETHQGGIGQFDLQVLPGGKTESQKAALVVSGNRTLLAVDPELYGVGTPGTWK